MTASPAARLLIVLLLLAVGCSSHGEPAWRPSPQVEQAVLARSPAPPVDVREATVVRVVDGDTVIGRLAGQAAVRVRIIGVDTPETVKPDTPVACFGTVASTYAKRLLTGRTVRVAYEAGDSADKYGRQLWDVWLPDGRFLAGLLVADGLGRAYPFAPDVRFAPLLAQLQTEAKAAGRGLWGAPCHGRSFTTPDRRLPP
jgi:micrococcal nuclease